MQSCRTCSHYDLDAVKDKAGRVRKGFVAKCRWRQPPSLALPDALTRDWFWNENALTPSKHMEPTDGQECPTYVSRASATEGGV